MTLSPYIKTKLNTKLSVKGGADKHFSMRMYSDTHTKLQQLAILYNTKASKVLDALITQHCEYTSKGFSAKLQGGANV